MGTYRTFGKQSLAEALAVAFVAAGCTFEPAISGFRPVYPPLTATAPAPFNMDDILNWPKVDSLQPTLRWQPFPGEHQTETPSIFTGGPIFPKGIGISKPFIEVDSASVSDVRYELRIWTVIDESAGQIAYEIEGLTEPFHKIERPLKPDTKYYWSVRARFSVNGQPRYSEWSLSQAPCLSNPDCARNIARLTGRIPTLNYYRFKTPL